ncbi:CNNM domain-containing protein [Haloplanus aerogenes]|uniref:CBS domain containing-hemolysin-like protein n=1 Tax=Haloplanus aerogenes TaxID=660522 RepID=A0A3M0CT69_9EURY|nr:hemolysin family protein [Haloplanus aerogenes]AZH26506.1 HlyC/CorC family transporter [Haloplanus aerogenes]RMB12734.1 CBS domain containing-hemolysin-like protein [Haloplanus aerogenes]
MTPLELGLRLVAGLLLILANGFFVAIEFALTRVRQYPESEFDTPALSRAWEMTQDLEIYLTSCQVGITASSIAVGIVAEPALAALFEPYFAGSALAGVGAGALIAYAIINLVHLTHGEQTPTYLGVERSKFVCQYGARPLYWFAWLISPIMRVGDSVAKGTLKLFGIEMTGAWLETEEQVIESRADLRNRLDSLLDEGDVPEERQQEVLNALAVDEMAVSEIVTDADDIVSLSVEASTDENLAAMRSTPHTRFPLVGDDLADLRGIVYTPSVLTHLEALERGERTFEDIAAPPMTLAAETNVSDAFDQFQAQDQELALVLEDGEVTGLVTATDALEAVMGELEDPLDRAYGE